MSTLCSFWAISSETKTDTSHQQLNGLQLLYGTKPFLHIGPWAQWQADQRTAGWDVLICSWESNSGTRRITPRGDDWRIGWHFSTERLEGLLCFFCLWCDKPLVPYYNHVCPKTGVFLKFFLFSSPKDTTTEKVYMELILNTMFCLFSRSALYCSMAGEQSKRCTCLKGNQHFWLERERGKSFSFGLQSSGGTAPCFG